MPFVQHRRQGFDGQAPPPGMELRTISGQWVRTDDRSSLTGNGLRLGQDQTCQSSSGLPISRIAVPARPQRWFLHRTLVVGVFCRGKTACGGRTGFCSRVGFCANWFVGPIRLACTFPLIVVGSLSGGRMETRREAPGSSGSYPRIRASIATSRISKTICTPQHPSPS
jgi:hypothetical protein